MPFQIIRNDITKVRADAIVNTANPEPIYASGSDYAIYMAAGADELLAERKKIGYIRTGEAAATPAFRLQAKYIIHTVGPAWMDGRHGELEDLASCYRNSLTLAKQLKCESIAFPLISTGVYGFPKDQALDIALKTISAFLEDEDNEMFVSLVVFNRSAYDLSAKLVEGVRQFIDDHYVEEARAQEYGTDLDFSQRRRDRRDFNAPGPAGALSSPVFGDMAPAASKPMAEPFSKPESKPVSKPKPESKLRPKLKLPDIMKHVGESFQERLLRLIDERGLTDAEVYKKANLDRKLFSKIRCNPQYTPTKRTALALAIALRLDLKETEDLIGRAGLALSPSNKFDLIVEYCIENIIYDTFEINALLFEYDQQLLGC